MNKSPLFYIFGSLLAVIMGMISLCKIVNEILKIKMRHDDGMITAKVVDAHIFTTGDVRPILLYTINGENKKYTYHFYHRLKEFPIGKEVKLRLSLASGLAYDKKDLIQGLLSLIFATLFFMMALLFFVYYYLYVV